MYSEVYCHCHILSVWLDVLPAREVRCRTCPLSVVVAQGCWEARPNEEIGAFVIGLGDMTILKCIMYCWKNTVSQ